MKHVIQKLNAPDGDHILVIWDDVTGDLEKVKLTPVV